MEVPLLSLELVDKGTGAHTSQSWTRLVEILGDTDNGVELGRTCWMEMTQEVSRI